MSAVLSRTNRLNLSWIFKQHFAFHRHPKYVNEGDCYIWAYIAFLENPGALLFSTWHHAFIKIGNLYYDSESPQGVRHWKELAFYRKYPRTTRNPLFSFRNPEKFIKFWESSLQDMKLLLKEVGYPD